MGLVVNGVCKVDDPQIYLILEESIDSMISFRSNNFRNQNFSVTFWGQSQVSSRSVHAIALFQLFSLSSMLRNACLALAHDQFDIKIIFVVISKGHRDQLDLFNYIMNPYIFEIAISRGMFQECVQGHSLSCIRVRPKNAKNSTLAKQTLRATALKLSMHACTT